VAKYAHTHIYYIIVCQSLLSAVVFSSDVASPSFWLHFTVPLAAHPLALQYGYGSTLSTTHAHTLGGGLAP